MVGNKTKILNKIVKAQSIIWERRLKGFQLCYLLKGLFFFFSPCVISNRFVLNTLTQLEHEFLDFWLMPFSRYGLSSAVLSN